MAITDWCKLVHDASRTDPEVRLSVIPGFDCLEDRLQVVLREQGPHKNSLKRKPAGGGQKRRKAKKAKARSSTPRLHEYQKLYADNLQDLKRFAAGKSNQYKFRSQPMPNFERSHKLLLKRKEDLSSLKKLTKPRCPRTLAKSMKALAKRKDEERDELKRRTTNSIPKINPSSSMNYMIRRPFKPRTKCSFTRPKPFKLHTTRRALGRFLYDKEKRERMEERFIQLANEWLESERREFLRLRKLTNFKANPNPWRETRRAPARGYDMLWQEKCKI